MRRLKLVARPPELGPLIIRYPLLYRAGPLCLFAYGLLMLGTDIGHVRGECCSRSYLNDDPAIEFSSLWVCGVAAQLVFVYRKIVFVGNIVRVSWLGGGCMAEFPGREPERQGGRIRVPERGEDCGPELEAGTASGLCFVRAGRV